MPLSLMTGIRIDQKDDVASGIYFDLMDVAGINISDVNGVQIEVIYNP